MNIASSIPTRARTSYAMNCTFLYLEPSVVKHQLLKSTEKWLGGHPNHNTIPAIFCTTTCCRGSFAHLPKYGDKHSARQPHPDRVSTTTSTVQGNISFEIEHGILPCYRGGFVKSKYMTNTPVENTPYQGIQSIKTKNQSFFQCASEPTPRSAFAITLKQK